MNFDKPILVKGKTIREKYGAKALFSRPTQNTSIVVPNSIYIKCNEYIGIYTSKDIFISPNQRITLSNTNLKTPEECTIDKSSSKNFDSAINCMCIYLTPENDEIHVYISNGDTPLYIPKHTLIAVHAPLDI